MCCDSITNNFIRNILVVDDEENARICLSNLLSAEGYMVSAAGDGQEALDYLQRGQYQLVITDINMPRMNGLDLADTICTQHPGLDVIMMTAFGGVDSYVKAMQLGVFEYLYKPVKLDELKGIMQKLSIARESLS